MKKLSILLLFSLLFSSQLHGVDKSVYDLPDQALQKSASGIGYESIKNDAIEITMISGGYFTIGTTEGISASELDDLCNITFGHPFAMTSYPIFSIDQHWYKPDDYFSELSTSMPLLREDTLIVETADESLSLWFAIVPGDDERSITFLYKLTNLDTVSHTMGTGLVFDPALGHWGDGNLFLPNGFLQNDSLLAHPDSLVLWEKSTGAKGLGIDFLFSDFTPDKVIAANWEDIYNNHSPFYQPSLLNKLYDLTLKMIWNEQEVAPGEQKFCKTTLTLKQPDFSSHIFMRWDLPSFIGMENNIMFPHGFLTYLNITNLKNNLIENAILTVDSLSSLSPTKSKYTVSIPAQQPIYKELQLTSHEIYEDKIVNIKASVSQNNQTLDEIQRNVFIPATPVSDTGLVVMIDSVITKDYPQIDLVFQTEVEETKRRVLDLRRDNVFLYENDIRIRDYQMGKFAGGGSNLADIVFVLDVSGSMGNEINQVRDNLGEFADSLAAKGYDYQIGVVTFSTTVDDVWDFTDNIEQIKDHLAGISLWGGIEDSPSALYRASELSFRPGSRRNIIWITDENYPEDHYTKEQIVNRMLSMDITVHGVGTTNLQTDWFNPIVLPTGGNFYDINGNFRDILLSVSRFESQDTYMLTFKSPSTGGEVREVKLEIHYAGLGGTESIEYTPPGSQNSQRRLLCFPNPFNPEITLQIDKSDYIDGEIHIFNILGQKVCSFELNKRSTQKIIWYARDQNNIPVGAGFYIVQLALKQQNGELHRETEKILYLK